MSQTSTSTKQKGSSQNNSKTNSNRRRRQRRNARRKAARNQTMPTLMTNVKLSDCARLYLEALVDPWSCQGYPCIPDAVILPSNKFAVTARGEFSTGTLGSGFLLVDPFQLIYNDISPNVPAVDNLPAENRAYANGAIIATISTYNQSGFDYRVGADDNYVATGVQTRYSSSPYDFATIYANTWQYRLVGCAVKIEYHGSMFRNQGTIYLSRQQGNSNYIPSGLIVDTSIIAADQYTIIKRLTNQGGYVYYTPDHPDFLAFNPATAYVLTDWTDEHSDIYNSTHKSLLIGVTGGDTESPQTFHYEIKAYYELIGRGLTLTKSHGDPVGHAKVLESLPNHAPRGSPAQEKASVLNSLIDGIKDTSSQFLYQTGRALPGLAYNMAGSFLNRNNISTTMKNRMLMN